MKQYLVLIAYEPMDWDDAREDVRSGFMERHRAFSAYVAEHGRELGSAALADAGTATTVRHVDRQVVVTDGPFAETAETVGGYYDVELPDLDTAIGAAALLPPCYSVEIRPVITVA